MKTTLRPPCLIFGPQTPVDIYATGSGLPNKRSSNILVNFHRTQITTHLWGVTYASLWWWHARNDTQRVCHRGVEVGDLLIYCALNKKRRPSAHHTLLCQSNLCGETPTFCKYNATLVFAMSLDGSRSTSLGHRDHGKWHARLLCVIYWASNRC